MAGVLAGLLLVLPTLGHAAVESLENLYRQQWTTREGLPQNAINAIVQTPEGYLWLATWDGLVRFNGREFISFGRREIPQLPDATLRALALDAQGRLVVGGGRGGVVRRGLDGDWAALPPALPMVTAIHGDASGRIWVGTEGDTLQVLGSEGDASPKILKATNPTWSGATNDIISDARGRIWAAMASGLAQAEGDALVPIKDSGLPLGPVTALANLSDGRLLAGTPTGLFVADATQATLSFARFHAETVGVSITRLLADPEGGVWIGTLADGLMHWSNGQLDKLGTGEDKPSTRILSLFLDGQGHLWVGTHGGLFRFVESPFAGITTRHGLPGDFVRSVLAEADGQVLVGTDRGLARVDARGQAKALGAGTALANLSILSLAPTDGGVWVGSYGEGVLRWDGQQVVEQIDTTNGLPDNDVRALVTEPDGTLWLGTARGLGRWRDGRLTRWNTADGLPGDFVIALHRDMRGRLWIGTGHGAALMDQGQLRTLDMRTRIDAEYAFAIFDDPRHDSVWIGSDRGLLRFDAEGRATGSIGIAQGLPFERIFGLWLDAQQRLWMSGPRGLARMPLSRAHAIADGQSLPLDLDHYTEADGMPSAQGNGAAQPVVTQDTLGHLWFATAMGAVHVDTDALARLSLRAPPVVIESLMADGEAHAPRPGDILHLPTGTRRLDIRYAGLGVVLPERLRYRTRLIGFDDDWVESTGQSNIGFSGLPPGTYQFQVDVARPMGPWGERPATLDFDIPPHWWQRRMLLLAIGVTLLLGGVAGFRWRVHRLLANKRELARLVEERTQEIERQKALLVRQAEEFSRQAREDALTGLANRRDFDERLARAFARAHHAGEDLCAVLVDIDHFKSVNDRLSHAVGDVVLRRLAGLLRDRSRPTDVVARWGGEEFSLLMPGTSLGEARQACERLRQAVAELDFSDIAADLRITASFGIAVAAGVDSPDVLMRRADDALYRAKANGRDRVES